MGRRNRQKGELAAMRGCWLWLVGLSVLVVLGSCTFYFREPIQKELEEALATPTVLPTPTPAPDFTAIIEQFRRAESAAVISTLEERNADVMSALAVFASGDALAGIQKEVAALQRNNQYERFTLEGIAVEEVVPDSPMLVKLLTNEIHLRETYTRTDSGENLAGSTHYEANVAYQVVYDGQRWRVDDLGIVEATPLSN